ncbi:MAG: Colicin production protein [Bacteroidetes bacterium]|nr:Colicin production protein [Bacteroidota bacterium]
MSTLDYFFLILMGIGMVFGFAKGAFRLLATLAGIVLGIYAARFFYQPMASMLMALFHVSSKVAFPLAFFVLFVAVGLGLYLLGWMMTKVSKAMALSWLNRLCGGGLGILQVALVLGVLINLYSSAHYKVTGKGAETAPGSLLYSPLKQLPDLVLPYMDFDKWNKTPTVRNNANDAAFAS